MFTAPDKRDSSGGHVPPAPPKRLLHKRTMEWSTDDDSEVHSEPQDLRDSGISTASLQDFQSHLTNLNNLGLEDLEPKQRNNDVMNISPPGINNSGHNISSQEVQQRCSIFRERNKLKRFLLFMFLFMHFAKRKIATCMKN